MVDNFVFKLCRTLNTTTICFGGGTTCNFRVCTCLSCSFLLLDVVDCTIFTACDQLLINMRYNDIYSLINKNRIQSTEVTETIF